MELKNKITTWYNGLPLNKTVKTAILLTITTSIVIGVGYLGYEYGKKIIIKPKKDDNDGNEQGTSKASA